MKYPSANGRIGRLFRPARRVFDAFGTSRATRRDLEHKVRERTKELRCLYGLSKLVEEEIATLDSIARGLVGLLVESWQYPEVTCARIIIEGTEYASEGFRGTESMLASLVRVDGRTVGQVEVGYTARKPEFGDDPFLDEERALLDAVAERLGRIIQRHRVEVALRESDQRLRAITSAARDAMILIDDHGCISFWNPAATRIFGYGPAEVFGQNVHELLAPQPYLEQSRACFPGFQQSGQGAAIDKTVELEAIKKGGEQFPVELSLSALQIDGRWHAIGIVRDITSRKQAERSAGEIERKCRILYESSRDAIMTATPEEGFLSGNPSAIRMFRCSDEASFASYTPADLSPEQQPDGMPSTEKAQEMMALAMKNGSHCFQWRHRRTDGEEFDATVLLTKMELNGRPILQATVRDVTEQKKREEQLARLNRELIDLSRQAGMSEVATGVLHNVGNVLNSVNVSANVAVDWLRTDYGTKLCRTADLLDEHAERLAEFLSIDPRGRRLPDYLRTLGHHLSRERDGLREELAGLLDNINHISEIVTMQQSYGHLSGVKEMVCLGELLDAALKLNDASFVRHNIEIVREYDNLPLLRLNRHSLLQVFVNLIANAKQAVKESARDDKRITLRIQRCEDAQVVVEVDDNGVGIRPEDLHRVFGYGYSTRPGGHGFGLHSSALATKELDGCLEVHSDGPDRGARFRLLLPLTIEEEALCPT